MAWAVGVAEESVTVPLVELEASEVAVDAPVVEVVVEVNASSEAEAEAEEEEEAVVVGIESDDVDELEVGSAAAWSIVVVVETVLVEVVVEGKTEVLVVLSEAARPLADVTLSDSSGLSLSLNAFGTSGASALKTSATVCATVEGLIDDAVASEDAVEVKLAEAFMESAASSAAVTSASLEIGSLSKGDESEIAFAPTLPESCAPPGLQIGFTIPDAGVNSKS